MANWDTLKSAVSELINTNGNQEITGQILQTVLNNIITNVGENATFAGIATLDTNPGTPDGPVFYLTATAGTYPNFNGLEVLDGEAVILLWNNNAWSKKVTGLATQEKLSELGSEVLDMRNIFQLESTVEAIEGQSQSGYVNADSGKLFLLETNKSVYYVPCAVGDTFNVTIPMTSNFGSVIAFSDKIQSDYEMLEHGVNNVKNSVQYSGIIKSDYSGYLIVVYMTSEGVPTVEKITLKSKELENFKKELGISIKEYTDFAADIEFDNYRYKVEKRDYVLETAYVGKKYVPIDLMSSDFIYESTTGVPSNQNFIAAFNKDKKLICALMNTTGAYIKKASLRDYIPSDLWSTVKYVSVNCYSTNIATASIKVYNTDNYIVKKDSRTFFDIQSGETIEANYIDNGLGVLQTDYIEIDVSDGSKAYITSSGYFNVNSGNTLKYYDSLKRLIKTVNASDITYLVPNSSSNQRVCVCVNDYIDEDFSYIKFTNYNNGISYENSFINIFYNNDKILKNKCKPSTYTNKILLTYGDSVTEGLTWQNQLAEMKGFNWDENTCVRLNETLACKADVYHYEVASGSDANKVCFLREDGTYYYFSDDGQEINIESGDMVSVHNRSTGVSGSMLIARPQNELNYRCVHKRIQEAQSFGPDIILIYGTYNDVSMNISNSEDSKLAFYGTVHDEAYYGLPNDNITFASSLKGIFEILSRTCPLAKIVYVGVYTYLNNPTGKDAWVSAYNACKYQNDLAREICQQYAIPFIDLQSEFGLNWYNHMKLMAASSPHPNQVGGDRTAEIIASKI